MRQYWYAYLVIFYFLLSSCSKDYGTINYKTDSMSLFNADNSGSFPQQSDDTVSGASYAIGMHFGFSFQESYDWDQNESDFNNLLTAKDFNIYSLEDFNAIPAGTSLNHLFHYCLYYNASSGLGHAISQENYSAMMSGVPDRNGGIPETWERSNYLFLMQPPTVTGEYHFCVQFNLSDGSQFLDTTAVYLIQ